MLSTHYLINKKGYNMFSRFYESSETQGLILETTEAELDHVRMTLSGNMADGLRIHSALKLYERDLQRFYPKGRTGTDLAPQHVWFGLRWEDGGDTPILTLEAKREDLHILSYRSAPVSESYLRRWKPPVPVKHFEIQLYPLSTLV